LLDSLTSTARVKIALKPGNPGFVPSEPLFLRRYDSTIARRVHAAIPIS
jgi:hypothetical protein